MNNLSGKLVSTCLLLTAGNACFGIGLAPERQDALRPAEWLAASDERLDNMRGGFDAGSGLSVSFGIVKTVMINGNIVTKISFNLPDISKITAETARVVNDALAKAGIIQNGAGNIVDTGVRSEVAAGTTAGAPIQSTPVAPGVGSQVVAGTALTTLIQNTLNDQKIQTLTVINAGVNSLGLLRTMNTQTILKDALFGSIGIR
ncbi:MAG: hypothetical protein Q7T10_04280 [Rhodoferax sp.]|uniref:hypothetical protein n=1 Tax=Rhodoferax sp. TaxID=50421 RepID=UPI0027186ACA|nr:hypothetical protein [Rhodoferax sp.]MDO8448005.1 hypothetical protein [Rhodoferax sp.]